MSKRKRDRMKAKAARHGKSGGSPVSPASGAVSNEQAGKPLESHPLLAQASPEWRQWYEAISGLFRPSGKKE
jgi:hypothetical protein